MKKRKVTRKKNNFDKYFLFSWKKIFFGIIVWIAAVILHNFIYGLGIYFGGENFWGPNGDEAFFFIVAIFVIPAYFVIMTIYTLIRKFGKIR